MPLITVTASRDYEPFTVRVAADEYTVVVNSTVTTYVDHERVAALTTAIQAVVPTAVVTPRPE